MIADATFVNRSDSRFAIVRNDTGYGWRCAQDECGYGCWSERLTTFAEEELPPPPPCSVLALPPPPPPALLLLPPPAPSAQGEQHVEAADMLAAPCSEQHAAGVVPAGADAERTAAAAC